MNAKFGMIASNNPIPDSEDYEEMRSRNEDTEAIYEVNQLISRIFSLSQVMN